MPNKMASLQQPNRRVGLNYPEKNPTNWPNWSTTGAAGAPMFEKSKKKKKKKKKKPSWISLREIKHDKVPSRVPF